VSGDLGGLPVEIRRRCLRSSYRICGREGLLPKSLSIPLCYNPVDTPQCPGGFADVWKGKHNGQVVAAKALRVYKTSDLDLIRKVCYLGLFVFISELTTYGSEVLQGGCYVEHASSPKRVASCRRDNDWG